MDRIASPPSTRHRFVTRRCDDAECGLRFPVDVHSRAGDRCPRCGCATSECDEPYDTAPAPTGRTEALRLELLLDNVRSLNNVGTIFRTADGAGIAHVHLGGITPTPQHPGLAKTALGSERSVQWTSHPDACIAAAGLRAAGKRLWAVESTASACSVFDPSIADEIASAVARDEAIVLVLGHEVSGIDPRIVDQCERAVFVPMQGVKGSLNVAVALGVVAYTILHGRGGHGCAD